MERKQVQEQVLADRGSVLDATIVRIMKTMKTMAHKDLMADVVKLIKFTCTVGCYHYYQKVCVYNSMSGTLLCCDKTH